MFDTLVNRLSELKDSHADKPAVVFRNDQITYAALFERIAAIGGALAERGVRRGDRVLFSATSRPEAVALYLGIQYCGAIAVSVDKSGTPDAILSIYEDVDGALLLTDRASVYEGRCRVISSDDIYSAKPNQPLAYVWPDGEDIAEMIFTTGTTGKSKGIVITHRANVALAENVMYAVAMRPANVEMIPLVMSHSHGLRTFYANLLNGSAIIITNGVMNVKGLFRMVDEYGVTAMDLSPSAAQFLIKLSKDTFWEKARKLDYIEIGTAALPEELKDQLVQNLPGVHLYNFYGSTESGRSCALDFSVETGRSKCIGRPTKNTEIAFTDEDRRVVEATPEKPGLLASRGPMNMNCYWKNEELSAKILVDGYVCTNDMGYIDADGFVYVIGRQDDVINFSGLKISPSEVEDIVLQHPNVAECALVGKEDPSVGQVPKLYVVAKEGAFDEDAFWAFLNERVDRAKLPKTVDVIDELPRTYNGKVDRKALAKM